MLLRAKLLMVRKLVDKRDTIRLARLVLLRQSKDKGVKLPPLYSKNLFVAGLAGISLGLASSVGLNPVEALLPLIAVVAGLTMLTAMAGSGPRAFL